MGRTLWAVSDIHVKFEENQRTVDNLQPQDPGDWLIVAGDVGERFPEIVGTLKKLKERFAEVLWVPGNHELFARREDRIYGKDRYRALVGELRAIGVFTPEDPYPTFAGVTICPLFTLYDYSFRPLGTTAEQAKANATIMLDDEFAIAKYMDPEIWCAERIEYTEARLDEVRGETILINHWPLVVEPTHRLTHQDIALWCGTTATRDWPVKYRARMAIHGHLHIPAETRVDGVSHFDVSLGYPFEKHPENVQLPPWPLPVLREN